MLDKSPLNFFGSSRIVYTFYFSYHSPVPAKALVQPEIGLRDFAPMSDSFPRDDASRCSV